ncbi:hypothetical protein AB4865_08560 [Capnocytophaga sp. ARDL2]|uniref:hypothetical protein n=1 Tax=Capnocytophaga sp. ARDL2 TaxID=3238809 RepID=UPI003556E641
MKNQTGKDGKLAAIIAHLTFLGPVIAWFINLDEKDAFGAFYIRQNLGLVALFFVLGALVAMIPNEFAFYGFSLFISVLWLYSFSGAISNQYRLIPIFGNLFQKLFARR